MEATSEDRCNRLREIAESCGRQQWSVAIRLLSSLPGLSSSPILLCNRALCYIKLELYKHVLKDCNKALCLSSSSLLAYLYKGQALTAMGKLEEGLLVWQLGYEAGLGQPSNLQVLLQLRSLATQKILATGSLDPGDMSTSSALLHGEAWTREATKNDITVNIGGVMEKEENHHRHEHKPNPAYSVHGLDTSLARGIAEVNAGNYKEAVQSFTPVNFLSKVPVECLSLLSIFAGQLIRGNPSTEAFVGRGTAYAFQQQLDAAIDDFGKSYFFAHKASQSNTWTIYLGKAIELDPSVVEAWKRRGQARAAASLNLEALADLSKALELEPKAPETLYERGVIYYKLKDFQSAIDDLRASLALDSTNRYAYNYFGLALISTGEYEEAMAAYCKVIELDPNFKEAWVHLAKLYKDLGDSEKSLECLEKALTMDAKFVHAHRLKAWLLFNLGDHRGAAKELTIGLEIEPHNPDLHYLRGSCYNAIGKYADAVKDYDEILCVDVMSEESRTLQILAFYQREIALYTVLKTYEPFKHWDIDSDLDPLFKEAWCKRLSPMVLFPSYNCQPLPQDLYSSGTLKPEDLVLSESKKVLLEAADRLGHLIQYNCPGFLKNVRQHRMAGLAVLDIAQKVATALQLLRVAKAQDKLVENEGKEGNRSIEEYNPNASVAASRSNSFLQPDSSHETHHKPYQRLKWRDLYSVAVKWRQASEPCDPVVWVDMLSEKEYVAGFGSHTPLLLGQQKVVRYYPNFPRAFVVAKGLILEQRYVFNAENRPVDLIDPLQLLAVDAAANCREMYDVVGEDFWLISPCRSTAAGGKVLDGTRFTLQKTGLNGYDFSIRTPCTPPRWADYDDELTAAWEEYWNIYCRRNELVDNSQLLKQLQDCVLRLSFYWYNFMPLARGTAAVGYVMLLALFLAADMEITASIPEGVQVDWEAILSPDLNMFIQAMQPWLYPSVKMNKSWQDLPNVSETFATFGSAITALGSFY